jgi:predicted esterase
MRTTNILKTILLPILAIITVHHAIGQTGITDGSYTVVVEGYDWGPAVNKVILPMEDSITAASAGNYTVSVERSADGVEMQAGEATGERKVIYAYVSDELGNLADSGNHVTLTLFVSPDHVLGSPIKYVRRDNRGSNVWINYKMTIKDSVNTWNKEAARIRTGIDNFDLTGSFSHGDITMSYASYAPSDENGKSPLIIWLHGGGEGGTDPSIPVIANKAVNYASEAIQSIFDGAFVLVPQSPTFWMQSASGDYTRGNVDDIYNEALMELIRSYVAENSNIDQDRIYVGGCSNGGYMSLKLILEHPAFFAAGFISALAYHDQFLSDAQINAIKEVPIWFVHAADDQTTVPDETVLPVYKRLIAAGAKNVHLSYYDHVTDITGFFGGDDYRYNGHWSWIYSHANDADFDFDGKPVIVNGRAVTIMEWMAMQSK